MHLFLFLKLHNSEIYFKKCKNNLIGITLPKSSCSSIYLNYNLVKFT